MRNGAFVGEEGGAAAEQEAQRRPGCRGEENGRGETGEGRGAGARAGVAGPGESGGSDASDGAGAGRQGRAHQRFQAAQEALRARADLVPAEQHRVAEYLGRSANASIIRDCDNPQQAIAAGLIASGTRDAKEATKGMEKPDAAKVVEAVEHNREIEKERRREKS